MRGIWWLHIHGIRRSGCGGVRCDGLGGLRCGVIDIPCGRVNKPDKLSGRGCVHLHASCARGFSFLRCHARYGLRSSFGQQCVQQCRWRVWGMHMVGLDLHSDCCRRVQRSRIGKLRMHHCWRMYLHAIQRCCKRGVCRHRGHGVLDSRH